MTPGTPEYTDELLRLSLKQGEQRAYEMIFKEWYTPLVRFADSLLGDADAAEDCVQRVFIRVWEKRTEIAIELSVKAYFYRAVRYACFNEIKHRKVKAEYSRGQIAQSVISTEMESGTGELEKAIARAVASMPDQCRKVFELSRFEGMKYAEIADSLNISVKTVENHMGKALRIMRSELSDFLPVLLLIAHGL
ncbi:MAG: RNA polymerase sigma-70 factor [Flavobacteriales bacterium]